MADYDIIIRSGTIVDGTRTPRYIGDLAIKDGKIAQIGGLKGNTADRVLELQVELSHLASSTCTHTTTRRYFGIRIARFPDGTA